MIKKKITSRRKQRHIEMQKKDNIYSFDIKRLNAEMRELQDMKRLGKGATQYGV